jgi:hypothetical protein
MLSDNIMTHEQKEANQKFDPPARDAEAFEAAMRAIEECRAKPSYDYQRVIICHTNNPDLGPKLARRSGAALAGPALPLDSKCALAVILIEKAGDCSLEMLESIVFFVNRTRGVVVLTATGQSFVRWRERWPIPAAQIRRRTHITIEFDR